MLGIFVMLLLNTSLVENSHLDAGRAHSTLFVARTQLFKAFAMVFAAVVFESVRSIVVA